MTCSCGWDKVDSVVLDDGPSTAGSDDNDCESRSDDVLRTLFLCSGSRCVGDDGVVAEGELGGIGNGGKGGSLVMIRGVGGRGGVGKGGKGGSQGGRGGGSGGQSVCKDAGCRDDDDNSWISFWESGVSLGGGSGGASFVEGLCSDELLDILDGESGRGGGSGGKDGACLISEDSRDNRSCGASSNGLGGGSGGASGDDCFCSVGRRASLGGDSCRGLGGGSGGDPDDCCLCTDGRRDGRGESCGCLFGCAPEGVSLCKVGLLENRGGDESCWGLGGGSGADPDDVSLCRVVRLVSRGGESCCGGLRGGSGGASDDILLCVTVGWNSDDRGRVAEGDDGDLYFCWLFICRDDRGGELSFLGRGGGGIGGEFDVLLFLSVDRLIDLGGESCIGLGGGTGGDVKDDWLRSVGLRGDGAFVGELGIGLRGGSGAETGVFLLLCIAGRVEESEDGWLAEDDVVDDPIGINGINESLGLGGGTGGVLAVGVLFAAANVEVCDKVYKGRGSGAGGSLLDDILGILSY